MTQPTEPARPSFAVALLGEAALGVVLGLILGPLAAIAISHVAMWTGWAQQLGMGLLAVQLFVGLAGYVVGLALGIHIVGRRLGQRGRPWAALVGGLIGILPVILVASRGVFGGLQGSLIAGLALGLLGALIGYTVTRRSP